MTGSPTRLTRRKVPKPGLERPCPSSLGSGASQRSWRVLNWSISLVLVATICVLYYKALHQHEPVFVLSSIFMLSDNESAISKGRLSASDDKGSHLHGEHLLACMPTVTRKNVEYVSNAVKSWRLAANSSIGLRRLVVIDMDISSSDTHKNERPEWLRAVFENKDASLPSWLVILRREGMPQAARKVTLGDSPVRIAWRSKEAQDYAQTLSRCAELAQGRYVLIVQDDVLFTSALTDVVQWADDAFVQREYIDVEGRSRSRRVCSLSLFDVAAEENYGKDLHTMDSSNMVARIWRTEDVERVVGYISRHFDEAPVDWLVDNMCRIRRRITLVKEPNAVRHRGAISSFVENNRGGLLT